MLKRVIVLALMSAMFLTGCSSIGYTVKSFVGTTESNNPQHRLVALIDFRGQRETKYEFKAGKAITVELLATKGSLDLELRSPKGQSIAALNSNGQLKMTTLDGEFEAGSYVLVFKSQGLSSGNVKVFMD
ncbi:MAG: hypothetical protein ACM3ZQ_06995 [Bacillota bacterium]